MGFVTQYSVSNIIVMGNLHIVKKDYILKLCGISHYTALSYKSFAADKCTVAHFCILADDGRSG